MAGGDGRVMRCVGREREVWRSVSVGGRGVVRQESLVDRDVPPLSGGRGRNVGFGGKARCGINDRGELC